MLERVGLSPALSARYPHELSGGQGQRVGIARAMVLAPRLLVCDEPVSSLDVPSQVQVVELLAQLKRDTGLALLFVSHNLAVVRRLCERVLVLYLGRMMELAATARCMRGRAIPTPASSWRRSRCRTRSCSPRGSGRCARGGPVAARSALRVRLPHALPARAAAVRPAAAAVGGGRPGRVRGLPLLARKLPPEAPAPGAVLHEIARRRAAPPGPTGILLPL